MTRRPKFADSVYETQQPLAELQAQHAQYLARAKEHEPDIAKAMEKHIQQIRHDLKSLIEWKRRMAWGIAPHFGVERPDVYVPPSNPQDGN